MTKIPKKASTIAETIRKNPTFTRIISRRARDDRKVMAKATPKASTLTWKTGSRVRANPSTTAGSGITDSRSWVTNSW